MSVKHHFTSRYGSEGIIIEADWSSLELFGWAFLTKDPTLYKLINSGQDMHRYVGGMVDKVHPDSLDEKRRKQLKQPNFLLVFGGSPWELQRSHGFTKEDAEHLYDTFWKLFPTAQMVQDNWVKQVEQSKVLTEELTMSGCKRHIGYMTSITGRKYYFKTYDESDYQRKRGKLTKFKKPEIYNNAIQGFCTSDIHMIAIGILFRLSILQRDKFVLVNTVHDSIVIDCRKKYLDFACNLIKDVPYLVIQRLKERFNIDFDLPLAIEIKTGTNWGDMKC